MADQQDLFFKLTPDFVLDAVEKSGWRTTGEYLQLNSYENRVFSLRLEEPVGHQIIVKFYRPGRWSEAAILSEHDFLNELQGNGVAVVAPLLQKDGTTLTAHSGLWMAAFPKAKGRMPQEFKNDDLTRLGRVVARLHNVGKLKAGAHRPTIDVDHYGVPAIEVLQPMLPSEIRDRYLDAAEEIYNYLDDHLDTDKFQRIHGDCHRGNVLETDVPGQPKEYFLIDFDDYGMGHPVQDFWMLFRHDEDSEEEIDAFLAGYTELREFDREDLSLMEPLRGLRIIHYASWIAKRWHDPSFPKIFPTFGSDGYWLEETRALESICGKLTK